MTIKDTIKTILRRYDRKLVYVPKHQVWGSDLAEDLRIIVGREDPLCFDIGANTGQTIHFLRSVFGHPTIHSFEPSQGSYDILRNLGGLPAVHLHNLGLGDQENEALLYEYHSSDLTSFLELADNVESRFSGAKPRRVENAPISTVDRVLHDLAIDTVHLLKSDTQGFDLKVLMGAKTALLEGRIRNVLVELNFIEIYNGQCGATEVVDYLAGCGFGLVDIYQKERKNNRIQWCNALFSAVRP